MNIKDLGKKNNENYKQSLKFEYGMGRFSELAAYEQLRITLKLEELRLLANQQLVMVDREYESNVKEELAYSLLANELKNYKSNLDWMSKELCDKVEEIKNLKDKIEALEEELGDREYIK